MGLAWLNDSGLKAYIDANSEQLLNFCEEKQSINPYEVQKHIFAMFDALQFTPDVEDRVKKFAYEQGTTMAILRRVGAIYLRNICLGTALLAQRHAARTPRAPE